MVFTLKVAKLNMNLNNFNMKIFKDSNDWNEKAIVGFIAFLIMCMIHLCGSFLVVLVLVELKNSQNTQQNVTRMMIKNK